MVDLLNAGYTLTDLENAMKAVGGNSEDDIIEGIFDCIGTVLVGNCIESSLSDLNETDRTGTITAIVVGAAQLVENAAPPTDDVDNYPFLNHYDLNNNDVITDAGEFVCTPASPGTCPTDLQLVNLILDLFNTGYTLTQMEMAMLDFAGPTIDPIITEIFDCLEDPLPTTLSVSSVPASEQGSTSVPSTTSKAFKQQAQTTSLQDSSITTTVQAEPEIPSVNTLLENPHVKALLENPDLNSLLENPDLNALRENPDVKALLEDPNVNALLEDPVIKAQLKTQLFPHYRDHSHNFF